MDELIGVVVMVLYLVAAGVAGKNKKQKKAKQRAARRQTATQFDQAFSGEGKRPPARSAPQTASLRRESVSEGVPCHDSMLRPERPAMRVQGVNQTQMRAAGEGEDPCHIAAASDMPMAERQITVDRSPIFNTEDSEAFASDVLRGVIMSEVLKRPCQRRAGGYTKRGA